MRSQRSRPDLHSHHDRNRRARFRQRRPEPARLQRLARQSAWTSPATPGSPRSGVKPTATTAVRPRLKLKSIQEMSLLDIDPKPLLGRTIRSAVLHLKKAGDEPLKRVTVSSVGAEWYEGTGTGYAIQPGGVTFRHRRHPDLPWSIGGGDICHVVLGNGGTIWRMADASPPDSRWLAAACRSTRESWQPAWLESAMGFLRSTTRVRNGRATARRSRSGFSPIASSTAASRTARAHPTSRSSSDRRIAGLPRPRRPASRARHRAPAGGRGPRFVGHAPRRRSCRHAGILRFA